MRKRIQFLLTLIMPLLLVSVASAQDPHAGGRTMMELFEATGLVGYLLVGCSVIGTTLVIEHMVNLRRSKLAPDDVAEELQALIEDGAYDDAYEVCQERPNYLCSVVGAALTMRHAGYEEMIVGLESAAAEETLKLNTKISYLSLIGNVAPLLGLLGTVTGMITSFQRIETLKAPTPGDLAVGVYESLVNTTMGLFIALLFLTAYFIFKNNVSKMALSINLQAVDMIKHLAGKKHEAAA